MRTFLLLLLLLLLHLLLATAVPTPDPLRLPSQNSERPCSAAATTASCPVTCFRPDPVCGEDGVTYWCGCADAACNGAVVAKLGFCEVGNGGDGLVSGQALLIVHILWLVVLGFSILCGVL